MCKNFYGLNTLFRVFFSKHLSILFVFLFQTFLCFTQVNLSDEFTKVDIANVALYQYTPKVNLTDSILEFPQQERFESYGKKTFSEGIKNGAHWFLLTVNNPRQTAQNIVFSFSNNELDIIKLYQKNQVGYSHLGTEGDLLKFNQRPNQTLDFALSAEVMPNTESTFLIAIQKNNRYVNSNITLHTEPSWQQKINSKQFLIGLYFGGLIFYLLTSLLFGVLLNKKMYWYYFGYVLFTLLFMLTKETVLFKYVYPNFPQANDVLASRFSQVALGFFAFFSAEFLFNRVNYKRLKAYLNVLGVVMLVFAFLSSLQHFVDMSATVHFLIPSFFFFIMVYVLSMFTIGMFLSIKYQQTDGIIFTIAFTMMLVTVLANGLGFFDGNLQLVSAQAGLYVALLIEITILSFYLVYNLKQVQDDKLKFEQLLNFERQNNIKSLIAGQERERKKIGREIHDALGSKFSVLLQMIRGNNKQQDLENEVESISNSIREISYQMMPWVLLESGLETTLRGNIKMLNQTYPQEFNFYSDGWPKKLDDFVENNLFRIYQEALNNALKYAQFNEFSVQLIAHDNKLVFQIEDDGIGFNSSLVNFGLGLRNLRTRAAAIDAKLTIDSSPGNGTLIMIELNI